MPTRDQLVTSWQRELAAAEAAVRAAPHSSWLARTRVRLYRFLIACYGDGQWKGDSPLQATGVDARVNRWTGLEAGVNRRDHAAMTEAPPGVQPPQTAAVFDSAEASQLAGKPAKNVGEIRSVLKSVAVAQEVSHAPGPLAAGLAPESWVVVAAASSKLKTVRCHDLLWLAGLHPRMRYRGDDHMVEVPAPERHAAFAIIESNRAAVRQPPQTPRTERSPVWFRVGGVMIVMGWFTFFSAWMIVAAAAWFPNDSIEPTPLPMFLMSPEFNRVWGSLFLATLLFALLLVVNRVLGYRSGRERRVVVRSSREP